MAENTSDKKQTNLVGKQFGDYKLIEALAVGGMSQIYKGEDVNLGRIVAVKVLTPELLQMDKTLVERFQREAKSVAGLEHDNIITIYQYGEQEDHYFLAMKLIQGEDLADELNNLQRTGNRMGVERMLHILGQVASALDYAHAANIIHRDIKPSNILIDRTDKATLTDFGLVLRNDNIDQTMGTAFGTPRYISPEQALASERAVPQSDIYSLAVIVYEILTGEMIYKADTAMGFALSHISEPPPPPRTVNPDIPRAVERELLKALDKIPEKRHDTATQFIESIREGYGEGLAEATGAPAQSASGTYTPVMTPSGLRDRAREREKQDSQVSSDDDTWTLSRDEVTPVVPQTDESTDELPTLKDKDKKRAKRVKKRSRKRGVGVMYVLFSAVVIGGVAVVGFVFGQNPLTNALDDTPIAGIGTDIDVTEAAITLPEGGEEVIVHYDFEALALVNTGEPTLDMTNLVITGSGGANFDGDRITTMLIPAGECILIHVDLPSATTPAAAACSDDDLREYTVGPNDVFWRAVGESETFSIFWNDIEIASCNTVARNNSDTCSFIWPDVEPGAEEEE